MALLQNKQKIYSIARRKHQIVESWEFVLLILLELLTVNV